MPKIDQLLKGPPGISISERQPWSINVSKFSGLIMELRRNSIPSFLERSRYLKCFNSPNECGITLRFNSLKSNVSK